MDSYCLRCRVKTGNKSITEAVDKRGVKYRLAVCDKCGGKKVIRGKSVDGEGLGWKGPTGGRGLGWRG